MNNQRNLTPSPNLARRAPGFWRNLLELQNSGVLTETDLAKFEEIFNLTDTLASQFEEGLSRPPEADFNPRPARIVQLLMKEIKESSCSVLMAAFFACTNSEYLQNLSKANPQFSKEIALAREALRFPQPVSLEAEKIALALMIDDLRHLHQRSLEKEDFRQILEQLQNEFVASIRHLENERLRELSLASIHRLIRVRNLENDSE